MRRFLADLKKRNSVLYWFGWLCFAGLLICALMTQVDKNKIVLGINAYIKPAKFFVSIWILSWTMGWYLFYLEKQNKVKVYSWVAVLIMAFELTIITWQASNGRMSHFNIETPLYSALYNAMGIGIVIFTGWTIYMDILFFKQKNWKLPMSYVWGIRIGILFFVIFSLEGGIMSVLLRHSIEDVDGGPGLPFLNWNTLHGDLRVAHFFGIHSLQIIPLTGFYLATTKKQVILFSSLYFVWLVVLLVQALYGLPFIGHTPG